MENFTPEMLGMVAATLVLVVVSIAVWQARPEIMQFAAFVFHRFVAIRRPEPNEPVHAAAPLLDANERDSDVRSFVHPPGDSLTTLSMNAEEVAAVVRMIEHKMTALKPTKTSTIAAGFGIRGRGDSPKYKRASSLYDLFFTLPSSPTPTYRQLDDQRRPALDDEPVVSVE